MGGQTIHAESSAQRRLTTGLAVAAGVSLVVVASSVGEESALDAPTAWPWMLTAIQVLSLWSAGRRYWWGWLMGGSVQLPWIAYAVMTEQIGFVPGCLISAWVQLYSFLRNSSRANHREVMA